MFLVTTADQRFWKIDNEILFLGEWCRLYRNKSAWSKLDAKIMPYHWDDREQLGLDYLYLKELYERCIRQLSSRLNELHGEDHSIRYWRIIIGPWLYYFMGMLFDRYSSIRYAAKLGKITNTWLPPLTPYSKVPEGFQTFQEWYKEDEYNHYLYGKIIEELGAFPYEIIKRSIPSERNSFLRTLPKGKFPKFVIKRILEIYGKIIPSSLNKIVFVHSFFNLKDLIRLQMALGQLPYLFSPWLRPEKVAIKPELRSGLKLSVQDNKFEKLLKKIIPDQIPTAYVENYAEMRNRSLSSFPRNARIIHTANALFGGEGYTFWIANQVERGAKLITSQHGGHYGTAAWSSNESHEIKVSDYYFSWGWEKQDQPKVIPGSSGQLSGLKPRVSPDLNGGILWLSISYTRFSGQLLSVPMSRQTLDYLDDLKKFASTVCPEVHKLLIKRIFPIDMGWNEEFRWKDMDSELEVYHGRKTMYQQLNESRLCIGTYNSTTDLETLSQNYPTIIFFNPKHSELRESAKPFYYDLRRVGIYHETPESAAAKVNKVYKDPIKWWGSNEVQEVRKKFCHQFARTSEDWVSEFKKRLKKIIDE